LNQYSNGLIISINDMGWSLILQSMAISKFLYLEEDNPKIGEIK
jgi:hypothetical protein